MKRLIAAAAVSLTVAAMASAASAVTVVGAKTIEITNAYDNWLQVAEVVATDGYSFADVSASANGGSAVGSDAGGYATGHEAPYAIDQNFNTNYYGAGSLFHSAVQSGGFLTITLGAPHTLSSLSIYGRSDCCSERDLYNVVIRNAAGRALYTGQIDAYNAAHVGTASFSLPSAAPEPAAWTLLISGFALTGAMLRRRRAALAVA